MGYYPQESLYKPYKYHGYTVGGTPNCPLKYTNLNPLNIPWFFSRTIFFWCPKNVFGVDQHLGFEQAHVEPKIGVGFYPPPNHPICSYGFP